MTDLHDDDQLAGIEQAIDTWLAEFRAANPAILAVDRNEPHELERRWYVRMAGEDKDYITVWLMLGQRTLRYETYVMPAPEENAAQVFEHVLRQNDQSVGVHFSIGAEDALYLRGELPLAALDADELDRIIGTMWATVERHFRGLLRLGFASRFGD